jgi:hypothetical protein
MNATRSLEERIAEKPAEKVTLEEMKAKIESVSYTFDGVLTVCIMRMRNGYKLVGKSAPASPENFDEQIGQELAYNDCIRQLWPLEGYLLCERLAERKKGAKSLFSKGLAEYRSHKIVIAAPVAMVRQMKDGPDTKYIVVFENGSHIEVSEAYVKRCNPNADGYYVRYDDGHESWSPRKAFEKGYTFIKEWGLTK